MSFLDPIEAPVTELAKPRVLSANAGVKVSPLCLGAMSIGENWKGFMGSMDKEQSFKLMDAFFEAGGNFIDTSNNYQDDDSENWVGAWMKERNNRDQIVVATKYTTNFASYKIGKNSKAINYGGNSRKSMHISVRESLKKLQTDYIDILYVHWWEYTTSIEEMMDALHMLVESGKVLYLGVSDTPAWIVSAANTYAKAHGKTPFAIYQGRWNIMVRDFERDIIPMARQFGMALAPWDVLGGGRLQSKKSLEERKAKGESLRPAFGGNQSEKEMKMSEALEKVAAAHGIDSVTAIALAYVMQKSINVFPIIGGRKVEHLHDNLQALSIHLSDEEVKSLEDVLPFEIGFPLNMIGEDPHYSNNTGMMGGQAFNVAWQKDGKPIGHE